MNAKEGLNPVWTCMVLLLLLGACCCFGSIINADKKDSRVMQISSSEKSFVLSLNNGWNLISIPYIPVNNSVESVFSSINNSYERIEYYNPINRTSPWQIYSKARPDAMNSLKTVNSTMGLWIYITNSTDLLFTGNGTIPASTTINLNAGWNLIGYPSAKNRTLSQVFRDLINIDFDALCFDSTKPHNLKRMSLNEVFHMGLGYWVFVSDRCQLKIDWA